MGAIDGCVRRFVDHLLIEPDAERLSRTAISKAGLAVSSFVP